MSTEVLQGTAYGRPKAKPNDLLTRVGPGTPMGELMRRYWQPVLASKNVTSLPKEIRILGEDLIIFRDKAGRPGLLYPRCMHRGTTLFYGRVEERGIRCCYHGWLFDVEGNCLEQPCEPDMGAHRDQARQPWYPVQERYGLVWTYMGPPEKKPVLPKYNVLEAIQSDEQYVARDDLGAHSDPKGPDLSPCSWLHMNDNAMDPFHVQQLHSSIRDMQFYAEYQVMPEVDFDYVTLGHETPHGITYTAKRRLDDGRMFRRVATWMPPNVMSIPPLQLEPSPALGCGFSVPVDDETSRILAVFRFKPGQTFRQGTGLEKMKPWSEMTIEERQLSPGDHEAQVGQGAISLHSEEHLATSDRGIAMQRRMLEQQVKIVQQGGDPVGVKFTEEEALVTVPSGNYFSAS